jgi:L,D-peptidoglycan transpeptidase YkuD (ErfK/YbiS/YcfS/YnhG family)
MILVVTKDWQAIDGQLQRFEATDRFWQPVGPPIRVVVGRSGMGWGRGEHSMPQPGPQKKEGDGKSPAGAFDLRYTFGSEPPEKVPGIKMPYIQCTRTLECVDDPKSPRYNQILDRPTNASPDWKSSEKMLMTNGQYRLGIVIEHDTAPPEPGAGSCVFMHIWLGPGIGTSGCTAMRDGDIEALIGWLDARANPILVQLPQAEYLRLQKHWRLPDMPAQLPDPPAGK